MKTIKLLILFATISLFTTAPFTAAEARDCSDPKGFHQKLMCNKLLSGLESGKSSDKIRIKSFPLAWHLVKGIFINSNILYLHRF